MTTTSDPVPERSARCGDVIVDGTLVVHDAARGIGHVLNPAAALVWAQIDGTRPVPAVVDAVGSATGLGSAAVADDVERAVAALEAAGLLVLAADGDRPGVDAEPAPAPVGRWTSTVEHLLGRRAGCTDAGGSRTVGGTTVEVRCSSPRLAAELGQRLAPLPAVTGAADHLVTVLDRGVAGPRRHRVLVDHEPVGAAATDDEAVALVAQQLNRLAVEGTPHRLLLHGGAVERDGRVVAVVGESGRGKSTLTAALVRAGWRYLTDEVVVIDPTSGAVEPYPKVLDLAPSALDLLDVDTAGRAASGGKVAVDPAELGAVSAGGALALLVHLGPSAHPAPAGAGAGVQDLLDLLANVFAPTMAVPGALDALHRLSASTPVLRLGRGPLGEAVAAVAQAIGAAGPGAAAGTGRASDPGVEPHLVAPVSARSTVQRRDGVHYTELAGAPLLCDVRAMACHLLSPGAAALWSHLDGRPVGEVAADVAGAELADVIELVRRLRAVHVVEDVGRHRAGPPPSLSVEPVAEVTVRARVGMVDGTTSLLLDDREPSGASMPVSLGPPVTVDGEPLERLVIGRHSVDPRQAVLQALLDALDLDREPDAATVEALAIVGESVPIRVEGPLQD